jgi:hypothetical protein
MVTCGQLPGTCFLNPNNVLGECAVRHLVQRVGPKSVCHCYQTLSETAHQSSPPWRRRTTSIWPPFR